MKLHLYKFHSRINIRVKLFCYTFFGMIAKTQTHEGFTSKVLDEPAEKHLHYIFFDLENCTQDQAIRVLRQVQSEFKLGDIRVFSDAEGSYRAWCFSKRPFIEYVHILIHTFPYLDFGFFIWTVRRTEATLRISNKVGRQPQKLIAFMKGYEPTVIPEKMKQAIYDTGIEKRGFTISIGEW